jgi:hypothetical protein
VKQSPYRKGKTHMGRGREEEETSFRPALISNEFVFPGNRLYLGFFYSRNTVSLKERENAFGERAREDKTQPNSIS